MYFRRTLANVGLSWTRPWCRLCYWARNLLQTFSQAHVLQFLGVFTSRWNTYLAMETKVDQGNHFPHEIFSWQCKETALNDLDVCREDYNNWLLTEAPGERCLSSTSCQSCHYWSSVEYVLCAGIEHLLTSHLFHTTHCNIAPGGCLFERNSHMLLHIKTSNQGGFLAQ